MAYYRDCSRFLWAHTVVSSVVRGQCVIEVAWEQARRNRGLELEPRERRGKDNEWTQMHMGTRIENTTLFFSSCVPLLCAASESPSGCFMTSTTLHQLSLGTQNKSENSMPQHLNGLNPHALHRQCLRQQLSGIFKP